MEENDQILIFRNMIKKIFTHMLGIHFSDIIQFPFLIMHMYQYIHRSV